MEPVVTEEWIARQPPEVQAIIRALVDKIAKLEAELAELRRQGKGKTPQNSSLPPSRQHPHAKPASGKPKSKKKRGGQPGHGKHERPLIPTEDCDGVEPPLTVIETCRQQRRNVFEYLTAAVHCHLACQPAPSLLPEA